MGYERNDRRYGGGYADRGNDYGSGSARAYGGSDENRPDYRGDRFNDRGDNRADAGRYQERDRGGRDQGSRDYGRDPRGYDYQDRGFFDRAGDEVRSWFGDEDAERRRRVDERNHEREERGGGGYADRGRPAPYGGFTGRSGGFDAADYGGGYSAGGYGGASSRDRSFGSDRGRDPGYHSWRDRQIQQFDQDYDEYRREHQSRFDEEFHTWRQGRQGQRELIGKVKEHQEVVGSDGQHIGVVDHVRGDRIKLTKQDKDAAGHHHTIPSSWITSVDDRITVNKTADQAKAHWRDEEDSRNDGGFFGSGQTDRKRNWSYSGS